MELKLIDKKPEAGDAMTFIFSVPEGTLWKAGQYMAYTLPHQMPDEKGVKRYFTIAAAPHEEHAQITTRINDQASSFKQALRAMAIGDVIEADYPRGKFVLEDPGLEYVFIAGGIGITPFRAILLDLSYWGIFPTIQLLYSNRTTEIVFKDELNARIDPVPNWSVDYIIDPERITADLIKNKVHDLGRPHYYVSGPEPMVEAISAMLTELGIAAEKIHEDFFPGYTWP